MARLEGKFLKGIVGNTTLKKWRNQQVVQMKIQSPRQTDATRKSAGLFGKASSLAKLIRTGLGNVHPDGTMVNRFQEENRQILNQCLDRETSRFVFSENSFDNLVGFEFNLKSQLRNHLWIMPVVSIIGNRLQVDLPELHVPDDLIFPGRANLCTLVVKAGAFALDAGCSRITQYAEMTIEKDRETVPAERWDFDVLEGCLCVVTIELRYYLKNGNMLASLVSRELDPCAVCAAIYRPGEFLMPAQPAEGPVSVTWRYNGLKLPAENND